MKQTVGVTASLQFPGQLGTVSVRHRPPSFSYHLRVSSCLTATVLQSHLGALMFLFCLNQLQSRSPTDLSCGLTWACWCPCCGVGVPPCWRQSWRPRPPPAWRRSPLQSHKLYCVYKEITLTQSAHLSVHVIITYCNPLTTVFILYSTKEKTWTQN